MLQIGVTRKTAIKVFIFITCLFAGSHRHVVDQSKLGSESEEHRYCHSSSSHTHSHSHHSHTPPHFHQSGSSTHIASTSSGAPHHHYSSRTQMYAGSSLAGGGSGGDKNRRRTIKKAQPRPASGRRLSYHTVSKCSSDEVSHNLPPSSKFSIV